MRQATTKKLLNAQKVDGAIIAEENGAITFCKAPWCDTEGFSDKPKVIPGRVRCEGNQLGFEPYQQTGEKLYTELLKTRHAVVRSSKRTVQVNYTFSRDLDKEDMMRYLRAEHKEILKGIGTLELEA